MVKLKCPNCQSSISETFNFCPSCAFKLDSNQEHDSNQPLTAESLSKIFGAIENPAPVAERAKRRLKKIGEDLGFEVSVGYFNPEIPYSQKQRPIGVVWWSKENIVAAFQVRSKRSDFNIISSERDLLSLQELDAEKKFIVYVSKITGKAYFNRIDNDTVTQKRTGVHLPENIDNIRKTIPRAYEIWTSKEEEDLIREFQSGLNPYELAKKHGRGIGGIHSRLKKLGLIED